MPPQLEDRTFAVSHGALPVARGAFLHRLFEPVDIASLVYFRIAFGAIMLWEVLRYFESDWVHRYYIDPTLYFPYYGFGWIRPWPGNGMYLHFSGLGVLAIWIMLGLWYRFSATRCSLGSPTSSC